MHGEIRVSARIFSFCKPFRRRWGTRMEATEPVLEGENASGNASLSAHVSNPYCEPRGRTCIHIRSDSQLSVLNRAQSLYPSFVRHAIAQMKYFYLLFTQKPKRFETVQENIVQLGA